MTDILGAMITPVVLLSGTGLFLLTTTTRLGRVVDRIRQLNAGLERLLQEPDRERRLYIADRYLRQLNILEKRGKALRRALGALHAGFACFLGAGLVLALLVPFGDVRWPAVVLACSGMTALFYAAVGVTLELRGSFVAVQYDLEIGRSAYERLKDADRK